MGRAICEPRLGRGEGVKLLGNSYSLGASEDPKGRMISDLLEEIRSQVSR